MLKPSFVSLQPWRRLPGSGLTVATQKLHFKVQYCFRVNFATPFRKPPCQAETGRVRATTIQCSAELFFKKFFIYFPPHWGSDPGQQQQHQLQECSRRRQSQHWPHTPHQHMGTLGIAALVQPGSRENGETDILVGAAPHNTSISHLPLELLGKLLPSQSFVLGEGSAKQLTFHTVFVFQPTLSVVVAAILGAGPSLPSCFPRSQGAPGIQHLCV